MSEYPKEQAFATPERALRRSGQEINLMHVPAYHIKHGRIFEFLSGRPEPSSWRAQQKRDGTPVGSRDRLTTKVRIVL